MPIGFIPSVFPLLLDIGLLSKVGLFVLSDLFYSLLDQICEIVLSVYQIFRIFVVTTLSPDCKTSFFHKMIHFTENFEPVFLSCYLSVGLEHHHVENFPKKFQIQSIFHMRTTINVPLMLNALLIELNVQLK